jgi:alpha-D-xyloside xylohydrolase
MRGALRVQSRVVHARALLVGSSIALGCLSCSSAPPAASSGAGGAGASTAASAGGAGGAPAAKSVDLGGGTTATLAGDGALSITRGGATVAASNGAAFGVFYDTVNPDNFHDPRAPGTAWVDAPTSTIAIDSPAPGVLHLALGPQGAKAALVSFALAIDGGAYLGLGERFDHVDAKGLVVPMFLAIGDNAESGTNDAHAPVSFFVDSSGYGVFVRSRQAGAFDVGADDPSNVRASFEGNQLDVYLYAPQSGDPLDVVRAYTMQSGAPRVPPLWAFAPMHWRNEWTDTATLFGDLDEYRTRHIPASTVWIDNPWETSYNDATLDPARFGDVAALMSGIAARGFKTIAWSTPYLEKPAAPPNDPAQDLYVTAASKGYFVMGGSEPFGALGCCVSTGLGMIDFTSPDATAFWAGVQSRATLAGFSGFKLDYGEDLVTDFLGGRLGVTLSDGETERTSRRYPLLYDDAYRKALEAAHTDGFLIGRGSSFGGQSHVDAIWPGDLDSDLTTRTATRVGGLPAAIVAAQSLAESGFPSFGSDTGGFRNDTPTRETLLRWAEHTAFSVIMQLGGGGDSHDPWMYDEEAATIYGTLARAHMQLVPYLRGLVAKAHADGSPSIRSLPLEFPGDAAGFAHADDEYLLGDAILVAPVTTAGATSRVVHVPPGDWSHWFTGAISRGPAEVTVDAPLGAPPVFVRAGAIVPLFPDGIDTLVASTAPGVVSLEGHEAEVEARVFATTSGDATWLDGASLTYTASSSALGVTWSPVAPVRDVFVAIDLRRAAFTGAAPHALTVTGAALTEVADEASVRASSASAFAVSSDGATMWLRLAGQTTASFTAS